MTKPTSFWWLFLLLWVLPLALSAQSDISVLKNQLLEATTNKEKMSLNYEIAALSLKNRPNAATIRKATIYANSAFKLAEQIGNRYYQRQSALLLGKSFIRQSDSRSTERWLNTALQLGKRHNDGATVLEAATLLSGEEVRKNNYERAYRINLDAINFINKNKNSLSKLDQEYANRKRALEKELVNLQAEIDQLTLSIEEGQEDPSEMLDSATIDSIPQTTVPEAVDTPELVIPNEEEEDSLSFNQNTERETYERSKIFPWLSAIFGLLALGLLAGLYYLWNKLQQEQEHFDHELIKKERLLRNYREEIQENERLKNQSIFGNGDYRKARKIDPLSILVMDMGKGSVFEDHPDDESFVAAHQKLLADIKLIMQLYPHIFYLKKIGTTLIFGTGLSVDSHAPDQLIAAAMDLNEYFDSREGFGSKPKIAVHSGSAMVSTLDLNGEHLDIIGHTFDQCQWLVSKAAEGQILISGNTAALLNKKDHLRFIADQKDWSGTSIELFELIPITD